MVREAQMNDRHASGESPQRIVARNFRELLGDVLTLGELQWQLFRVDLEQCKASAVAPLAVLAAGGVLLLSCVPVALVTLAICLDQFTRLTAGPAFLVALGIGLVLGGLLCLGGAWYLRRGLAVMKRSQDEFGQNYRWLKKMLGRLGTEPFQRQPMDDRAYNPNNY
jgi:uncharacterized membrane protein YqjE